MQRINWFPDPLITGTMKIETGNNAKIDYLVVNNRNWVRATSVAAGDNYGQYTLLESRLPPAGTYHVHALTYAQKATADFRIYARVDGTYRMLLDVPVGDDMTITIDQNITIPSNTDQLFVRIAVGQKTVGAKGMMSDILIERADTYGTAVGGGASGLLHGRHDAARIGASVGRVMSDDGHEPMHEPILDHHPESRQVGEYHDPSEREWGGISDQRRGERHRRHYLDNRSGWRHQRKTTCQLQDDHQQFPSGINELSRQVRQSDRHSDEHAHLHVGRIPGEQDPARQHRIFRRGYDAARLTLALGVVA